LCSFLLQGTTQLWIKAAFHLNRSYIASSRCINRFDAIPLCKGSCVLEEKLEENREQQEKTPDLKPKEIVLFCEHKTAV
jgi:hypothetical protein